jgi:hypothetical protein
MPDRVTLLTSQPRRNGRNGAGFAGAVGKTNTPELQTWEEVESNNTPDSKAHLTRATHSSYTYTVESKGM